MEYCVACKWCDYRKLSERTEDEKYFCKYLHINVVTGKPYFPTYNRCSDERYSDKWFACGKDAQYFEPLEK